jgi:hypothetical protein
MNSASQNLVNDDTFSTAKPNLIDSRLSILNVKTTDHAGAGFTCGSIRSLGWAEISAALSFARLSEIGYLIVRVVHCGDKKSMQDLIKALVADRVMRDAANKIENPMAVVIIRGIAVAALFDYLSTTATVKVSQRQRCQIAGVALATYQRKGFDHQVTRFVQLITDHYDVARTKIHQQLVK